MNISRRFAFAAAAVIASSFMLCGCEKKNESSPNGVVFYDTQGENAQNAGQSNNNSVPEKKPAETVKKGNSNNDVEVEYTDGIVGEDVDMKGISVNLETVEYLTKKATADNTRLVYCMFNIKNVTDSDISVSGIDNFTVSADGAKPSIDAVASVRALVEATNKLGDDKKLSDFITSGNTKEGYIAIEIPENASTVEIIYYPYKGIQDKDNNLGFRFKINTSDIK